MQHFPELFETLLRQRGIVLEEKEDFLNPDYDKLCDPLLLPDMLEARDRVIKAIENNEHIVIFSDYDADGVPGAIVLSDFFKRIKYENISFYIPHRHNEGFGLNPEAIEECAKRGAKLIITIDCGIADIKETALANELGMDVIITDHHKPGQTLPKAYAVVNPNREDSGYPFNGLCGSAVVFKLVQSILAKEPFGVKPGMEKWSLDMVAIATLSDMVPLVGENRILARFGLEVLRKSPRPGLEALFRRLNLNQKNITEDDVVFMITPRINAASRMGVPEDAFNLLRTTDLGEAEKLTLHLEKINNERKGVVASIVKEAKSHLSDRQQVADVIVVGNPDWRPALLGLVANSLVEEYRRPVFVWGRDGGGVLKGSCRSYNGYDLFALMSAASDSFIEFGGHMGAGGFSVTLVNLTTLEERLSLALSHLEAQPPSDGILPLHINLGDIGENLWETVSQFAPFGMGNQKPIFKIPKAEIKSVKKFGKENNHLEIMFNGGVKAIAFFSDPASYSVLLTPGTRISLLANLEKSFFRNRPELRLRIVDMES
ncbi:MAG: Single-stranded-DNA-specific exonuclease recJ [Candidatus Nomurabacteria bacterium GW2011_GWA1_46_11]|uniref:Single-stranded-DNA-specific exonuclease RecJ n=1 Tax=Candidatus Nomurabacteria bacterium GW2011_GWA1_46_11 TaxID=1618732 RepID=A0A0G1NKE0_9BACT|nr:MAG: Single-stranded-DNA-specific exonuclease recJ [Candidatus Nomurabacteria bacterium GW2011_GWA1_46_11]